MEELKLNIVIEEYDEEKGKATLNDPKYDWSTKETDLKGGEN